MFFNVSLKKRLNEHSSCRWFRRPDAHGKSVWCKNKYRTLFGVDIGNVTTQQLFDISLFPIELQCRHMRIRVFQNTSNSTVCSTVRWEKQGNIHAHYRFFRHWLCCVFVSDCSGAVANAHCSSAIVFIRMSFFKAKCFRSAYAVLIRTNCCVSTAKLYHDNRAMVMQNQCAKSLRQRCECQRNHDSDRTRMHCDSTATNFVAVITFEHSMGQNIFGPLRRHASSCGHTSTNAKAMRPVTGTAEWHYCKVIVIWGDFKQANCYCAVPMSSQVRCDWEYNVIIIRNELIPDAQTIILRMSIYLRCIAKIRDRVHWRKLSMYNYCIREGVCLLTLKDLLLFHNRHRSISSCNNCLTIV